MSNTLSKYSNVNFATPVLFRGQDIKDFNKASYLSMIRQLAEEIKSYSDIEDSEGITALVVELNKDKKRLTKYLDELLAAGNKE